MVEPLEYNRILEKLVEKTQAGRLDWQQIGFTHPLLLDEFVAELEQYKFYVGRTRDGFGAGMEDSSNSKIFEVLADEEIIFRDPQREEKFRILSDLYELARRKALNVPAKLANAVELLDKV